MKHLLRLAGFLTIIFTVFGGFIYISYLLSAILEKHILFDTVVFWVGFAGIIVIGFSLSVLFFAFGSHVGNHWSKDYGTAVLLDDVQIDNEILKKGTFMKVVEKDRKQVRVVRDLTTCVIGKQYVRILKKGVKVAVFNVDLKAGDHLYTAGTIGDYIEPVGEDKVKVLIDNKNIVVPLSSITIR